MSMNEGVEAESVVIQLGARLERLAGEEPLEQMRVRRAVVHPAARVLGWEIAEDPTLGVLGSLIVTVSVAIGLDVLMAEDRPLTGQIEGDCGGPGDRLIAQAARIVTGESDPARVAEALGRHHVRRAGDLPRELGLRPGEAIVDPTDGLGTVPHIGY